MKNGICEITNYSKGIPTPGVPGPEVHVKTVMHGHGDPGYLLTASKHPMPAVPHRAGLLTPNT